MLLGKDTDVQVLVELFSAMRLEDDVTQDEDIKAAGQSTSHINFAQPTVAVNPMDVDTEEPRQPCRGSFSQIEHEGRLSTMVRLDAMVFSEITTKSP